MRVVERKQEIKRKTERPKQGAIKKNNNGERDKWREKTLETVPTRKRQRERGSK